MENFFIIIFLLVVIFLPLFLLTFFLVTLIRDWVRNFDNIKIKYGTSTNLTTGNITLELRYWVWEFRKRRFFLNYIEGTKIIYLEGNIQVKRTIYYKDVPTLAQNSEKSFLRKSIRIFTE